MSKMGQQVLKCSETCFGAFVSSWAIPVSVQGNYWHFLFKLDETVFLLILQTAKLSTKKAHCFHSLKKKSRMKISLALLATLLKDSPWQLCV